MELGVVLARVVRVQHLERADAAEGRLLGPVDLAHPAAGDKRHDLKALVDDTADERVGRGGIPRGAGTIGHVLLLFDPLLACVKGKGRACAKRLPEL